MTVIERQEFRLRILKKLCEVLNFDLNKDLGSAPANIFNCFPGVDEEELLSDLVYLYEKGYVTYQTIGLRGTKLPLMIKITVRAIDLIEKIETQRPTQEYEQDFSKVALNNFSNISNSNIIVSSTNASITISKNDEAEILRYFDDLINKNPENEILKKIAEGAKQEIKKGNGTKEFLRGICSTLKSIGFSVVTNLLTPALAEIMGISLS